MCNIPGLDPNPRF